MPQYVYTINGQRHVFEGPDAQTTARYAKRWAAQEAARTPVTAADIQQRLGAKPGQFAADLGERADRDVGDFASAIDAVKAHPASLLNGPRVLEAVARYVPNAFGLVPAAGVDQMTGPIVRGINARFGSHFDPHGVTDQLLNAAGLALGSGEMRAEEALPRTRDMSTQRELLSGPPEVDPSRLLAGPREIPASRIATHVGKLPQLRAPTLTPKPNLTVAYEAPELGYHVLGQNSEGYNVVPLSDEFIFNHQQRMKALEDLPQDVQDKYESAINDLVLDPILDDPDYGGHNSADVEYIREELAKLAAEQRGSEGNAHLADALDAANEDFRIMVNQQQPEMAKELGLTHPNDSIPQPYTVADPDQDLRDASGKLVSYQQHVAPTYPVDDDTYDELGDAIHKFGQERVAAMMKGWSDIDNTANDNDPLPNWAGAVKPKERPILPEPADFNRPKELWDKTTDDEKQAWMATAANDNAPRDSEAYLSRYLPTPWSAPRVQLPAVWTSPRSNLPVAGPRPANAFSDAPGLEWTVVPRFATNGLNFNALRPTPWGRLGAVTAANLPQNSQQPQN
jgi:hypothetical protein